VNEPWIVSEGMEVEMGDDGPDMDVPDNDDEDE